MTREQRHFIAPLLLLLALLVAAVLSYLWLSDGRASAIAAAADLRAARQLAGKIEASRGRPSAAGAEGPENELRRQIAAAAQFADIPAASLGSIEARPPRRLGDSAYQERPTQVALNGVTLRQVIQFCHVLSEGGLRVVEIRLSAVPQKEKGERWAANATLSYLVYAPKGRSGQDAGDADV